LCSQYFRLFLLLISLVWIDDISLQSLIDSIRTFLHVEYPRYRSLLQPNKFIFQGQLLPLITGRGRTDPGRIISHCAMPRGIKHTLYISSNNIQVLSSNKRHRASVQLYCMYRVRQSLRPQSKASRNIFPKALQAFPRIPVRVCS
jgi:hypothetical protein